MALTMSDNLHQSVIARATVPGITVQLEDNWQDDSGAWESYCICTEHVLSLMPPDGWSSPTWTRFASDDAYVPHRNLLYDPPGIQRQSSGDGPLAIRRCRAVACYFEPQFFHQRTGLGGDWTPAHLKACHAIKGPLMVRAMEQLFDEMSAPGFASDILVDSLGQLLTVEIGRYFRSLPAPRTSATKRLSSRHLDCIREYVDTAHGHGITVEELARVCGLSADYLRHAFRDSTGQSLGSYVEQIRITKAKGLLTEGRLSIKQIAHHVGFANPGSFSVAFRRATGETPNTYRVRTHGP